jgi:hypothetical protein
MSRRQRLKDVAQDHGTRGAKGQSPGRDLWGKRPMAGNSHSSDNKRFCRRIERRMAESELRKELEEIEGGQDAE